MTVTHKTGKLMDVGQGMIETTTTRPPMDVVSTDTMMVTTPVTTGVMTAMDIAVGAVTVAAEEVYTSVV